MAVRVSDVVARGCRCIEAAIVSPVEADPRAAFAGNLILNMGSLVEPLIMVDTERIPALSHGGSRTCALRREESCSHGRHRDEGREVVIVRKISVDHKARNLRVVPIDGEEDGRVAEDGEVERAMRVLPDVVAADDKVLSEALLKAGMKLVPIPRRHDVRSALAVDELRQNGVCASLTGQHKGFV